MSKAFQIIHPKVHGRTLNVKVRKPQKRLNHAQGVALAKMYTDAKRRHKPVLHRADCFVIFFTKPGGGKVAVQRCAKRHTFKSKSFASKARDRVKKLCRGKNKVWRRCGGSKKRRR